MMKVAFASMTGNVKRFAENLEFETIHIKEDTVINEPFVLITYTTGFGLVPKEVQAFLQNDVNAKNLVAVVGSGNRNWGNMFCGGAKTVAKQYNVPLLHTFEMSGYESDVEIVTSKIKELQKG
jgi:protein involved in ribonucleotide reduction